MYVTILWRRKKMPGCEASRKAREQSIDSAVGSKRQRLRLRSEAIDLDPADGAGVNWLYRNAEAMTKAICEDGRFALKVRIDRVKTELVKTKFFEPAKSPSS